MGIGTLYLYAIGLGSNRRHGQYCDPSEIIKVALVALHPTLHSSVVPSRPVGPSSRTFANAAALIESDLAPAALLRHLKQIERDFGRRPGRRWGTRVLDLDILLWSGGRWSSRLLAIPHKQLTQRRFALDPLAEIVPAWRIPGRGTVRQAAARLTRPRPVHRSGRRSGL